MDNYLNDLETITGIQSEKLEKIISCHEGLRQKFATNKTLKNDILEIKTEIGLPDNSFQVLFAANIQNFACIQEVRELASNFASRFEIDHTIALIHSLKSPALEFSDPTTIMGQFDKIFARIGLSDAQAKIIIQKCPALLSIPDCSIHSNIDVFEKKQKL